MRTIPNFFVFTSPLDIEDGEPKSCYIVVNIHDNIAELADFLDKNTLLSVDSYVKKELFRFTFDTFYCCYVLEVHLKEEAEIMNVVSCEQIAIAEIYSYLSKNALLENN